MRIVDYRYTSGCGSDWLAQWARSVGWEVSIGDSTDRQQVGVECGFIAAVAQQTLNDAGDAFMTADTSNAVLWETTRDQLQWLQGRDTRGFSV